MDWTLQSRGRFRASGIGARVFVRKTACWHPANRGRYLARHAEFILWQTADCAKHFGQKITRSTQGVIPQSNDWLQLPKEWR
jgi:hypothetical protein